MNRLLVIIALILCVTSSHLAAAAAARLPKIYNALITSDENLSPSQAYPIIEPVLRTSALGVAFPPLVVHPQIHNHGPPTLQLPANAKERQQSTAEHHQKLPPQLTYHGSLYPLAYDPYLPYGYHQDLFYPALPAFYQHPVYVDFGHYQNNHHNSNNNNGNRPTLPEQEEHNVDAAKQVQPLPPQLPAQPAVNINFKKNPDIPDVIPPLPVRSERKRNS